MVETLTLLLSICVSVVSLLGLPEQSEAWTGRVQLDQIALQLILVKSCPMMTSPLVAKIGYHLLIFVSVSAYNCIANHYKPSGLKKYQFILLMNLQFGRAWW